MRANPPTTKLTGLSTLPHTEAGSCSGATRYVGTERQKNDSKTRKITGAERRGTPRPRFTTAFSGTPWPSSALRPVGIFHECVYVEARTHAPCMKTPRNRSRNRTRPKIRPRQAEATLHHTRRSIWRFGGTGVLAGNAFLSTLVGVCGSKTSGEGSHGTLSCCHNQAGRRDCCRGRQRLCAAVENPSRGGRGLGFPCWSTYLTGCLCF